MPERNAFGGTPPAPTRAGAEAAIEAALKAFVLRLPVPAQLGDLADAIDALNCGSFGVAISLALAARSHRVPKGAERPATLARTLEELRVAFDTARTKPGDARQETPPRRARATPDDEAGSR